MSSAATNTQTDTLTRPAHPFPPPWVPRRRPPKWTLSEVVKHGKTAMLIELTTIPLYLYAAYSVDVDALDYLPGPPNLGPPGRRSAGTGVGIDDPIQRSEAGKSLEAARDAHVVVQEMVHLALSGNLVCALDGFTELYDYRVIPQFPGTILYERVEMDLNRADQANLTLFKEIEQPVDQEEIQARFASAVAPGDSGGASVLPEYRSIGEFYENLKQGLATLSNRHLKHNPSHQFSPNDFNRQPEMAVIRNQEIAQSRLELIVEEGEGGPDVQESHYAIFSELSAEPAQWKVYNVRKNPRTEDYKGVGFPPDFAYVLSLAFDAGYCYLLQTIQRVWGRGGNDTYRHNHLVGNMLGIMKSVMPALADVLVHQPLSLPWKLAGPGQRPSAPPPSWPSSLPVDLRGDVAAPCFDYYPPLKGDGEPDTPLEPEDLYAEFLRLVEDATAIARTFPYTQAYVRNLEDIAEAFEPLTPYPF